MAITASFKQPCPFFPPGSDNGGGGVYAGVQAIDGAVTNATVVFSSSTVISNVASGTSHAIVHMGLVWVL